LLAQLDIAAVFHSILFAYQRIIIGFSRRSFECSFNCANHPLISGAKIKKFKRVEDKELAGKLAEAL